jgi:UDP-GlcNAc:undecaprenyl-phosphate/decaprenyl-phosphate GlcNAc-1-phosphate transferase
VAKVGGVCIFISVFLSVVLGLFFFYFPSQAGQTLKIALILSVTFLAAVLGFFDDIYDLKPRVKLLMQTLLFGTFAVIGFHFEVLHIPGFLPVAIGYFGIPLTIFWLLAVVNGFNFMDGVDGLAGSVTAVCLATIWLTAHFLETGACTGVLWASALGAVLAFLVFNWRPAKIYLGDSGSMALGTLVGASLIALGSTGPAFLSSPETSSAAEPFRFQFLVVTLFVGYPLLEVGLSTLRRGAKMLSFGRSMEQSEQEHIHHNLLDLGLKANAIALIAVLFQAVLAASGILAVHRQNALAIWIFLPLFAFLVFIGPRIGLLDFLKSKYVKAKPHYQIAHHFIALQRIKLKLAGTQNEILALLTQTCAEMGVKGFIIHWNNTRDDRGNFHYLWKRKEEITREYLDFIKTETTDFKSFKDHLVLMENKAEVDWIFEPHTEESDLDIEYRVLVSEFMKDSLKRFFSFEHFDIQYVNPNIVNDAQNGQLFHAKTRASFMRRKYSHKKK